MDVELEAVLGVEAARLHDVPHQRIEYRQREAGDFDHRLLLRLRGWRYDTRHGDRECGGKRGEAAARQFGHGQFPLVVAQTVILRVTWLECERDFTPLSFACN